MTPRIFRIFAPVTDADKDVAFYQQLLDTEGRIVHRGRHYFDCGPVIFAVIENNGPPIGDHIYFAVSDLEDVFERAKELACLERSDIYGSPSDEICVRRGANDRSTPATHSVTGFASLTIKLCSPVCEIKMAENRCNQSANR